MRLTTFKAYGRETLCFVGNEGFGFQIRALGGVADAKRRVFLLYAGGKYNENQW
jgi:hypothetical protein